MARTIPIIELRGNLIVAVQTELSDRLVSDLKEDLCCEIQRRDADGLVIEVSGVDIFDTFIAHSIREIAQVVRLMGVQTVLAGLDPSMAITLVEMGMTMQGVDTAMNLESALSLLEQRRAARALTAAADPTRALASGPALAEASADSDAAIRAAVLAFTASDADADAATARHRDTDLLLVNHRRASAQGAP